MKSSLLTENQKQEVLKRSSEYKSGKVKVYTLKQARKEVLRLRDRPNDKHSFK